MTRRWRADLLDQYKAELVRYKVDNGATYAMMSNSLKVTLIRSVLTTTEAKSV